MICVGLSDILYPGDTLDENSCIVYTDLSLLYAPVVTFNTNNVYVEDIYQYVWFMPLLRLQYAIRWKS